MTIYSLKYSFPNLEPVCCSMSSSVASWPAYKFLKRQVRWSGISISWRIFHSGSTDPHSQRLWHAIHGVAESDTTEWLKWTELNWIFPLTFPLNPLQALVSKKCHKLPFVSVTKKFCVANSVDAVCPHLIQSHRSTQHGCYLFLLRILLFVSRPPQSPSFSFLMAAPP